jgi:hypothetical protein
MMASVGTSTSASAAQVVLAYEDVTASGVFNLASRRFTIATGIITGSHYQFYLSAYNGVEFGGYSPISDVMIAAIVPTVPLSVSKLSSSKTSVSLLWTTPTSNGGAYIM